MALSYLRSYGPTAQQTLAERLRMDPSSMVCLLNELEDSSLVVRHRDRTDRRRAIIELSRQGTRVLCDVDRALEVVEDEILEQLDPSQRTTLRELLARLDVGEPDWGLIASEA